MSSLTGGQAPNIVPAEAEVRYFGRSPSSEELQSLWQRLNKVAQGAAMMTETEVSSQLLGGCYNTLPNKVLNRVLDANLRAFAGTISFDARELAFAAELQQPLPPAQVAAALARAVGLSDEVLASNPLPCFDSGTFIMGSSDVGDVANIMPTSMLWGCAWPVGVAAHTWQPWPAWEVP